MSIFISLKHQKIIQEIIDLKGSCINLEKLKYKPLTAHKKSRLISLDNQLREIEKKNSNDWKELLTNVVEIEEMEIVNYQELNKGCLRARFDIKVPEWGGLTIRGCSLFQKEGRHWVGMPSNQYQNKQGETKSYDLVSFDKSTRSRLEEACIEKIQNGNIQARQGHKNNSIPF